VSSVFTCGQPSPTNHDSALQPETVLVVVLRADREDALIAEAAVEISDLDEANRNFIIQLDVKASARRQGESVLGKRGVIRINHSWQRWQLTGRETVAIVPEIAVIAGNRDSHSTKVNFDERLKWTAASEGHTRPKQIRKLEPRYFGSACAAILSHLCVDVERFLPIDRY
jgi:hypothetical protein